MTDELNEAAEKYAYNGISDEMKSLVKPIGDEVIKNFKAGAEWQREQKDPTLADIAEKYAEKLDISRGWFDGGEIDDLIKESFEAGAEWQKEQMLKIITKDDNLEEAGTQYVETYFRDIDWTPDVIKSCLEEAFISGGEYVFKQIKYE